MTDAAMVMQCKTIHCLLLVEKAFNANYKLLMSIKSDNLPLKSFAFKKKKIFFLRCLELEIQNIMKKVLLTLILDNKSENERKFFNCLNQLLFRSMCLSKQLTRFV